MVRLGFGTLSIELADEPIYSLESADNSRRYGHVYRLDDEPHLASSRHGLRVFSEGDGAEVASCLLVAAGGASGVHDRSAVVNSGSLVVAVGPFVVSLRLPTLELEWHTRTDEATCFGVYHSPENRCYVSHGELSVARLSYTGEIEWVRSGADIFTNGFNVAEDRVEAVDWNDDVYVWDIGTGKPLPPTAAGGTL